MSYPAVGPDETKLASTKRSSRSKRPRPYEGQQGEEQKPRYPDTRPVTERSEQVVALRQDVAKEARFVLLLEQLLIMLKECCHRWLDQPEVEKWLSPLHCQEPENDLVGLVCRIHAFVRMARETMEMEPKDVEGLLAESDPFMAQLLPLVLTIHPPDQVEDAQLRLTQNQDLEGKMRKLYEHQSFWGGHEAVDHVANALKVGFVIFVTNSVEPACVMPDQSVHRYVVLHLNRCHYQLMGTGSAQATQLVQTADMDGVRSARNVTQLRKMGWRTVKVEADGDCLFHCLLRVQHELDAAREATPSLTDDGA